MIVWRISDRVALDGGGGLFTAGRWHSMGRPIVYCAEHQTLAMLEALAHIERTLLPESFQWMRIHIPDELPIENWTGVVNRSDLTLTRFWGDDFLTRAQAPVARVPTVIAPDSVNFLINPAHPDSRDIAITDFGHWPWDQRLFK